MCIVILTVWRKIWHTKFLVENGDNNDEQAIKAEYVLVEFCDRYVYFGSQFTVDGSVFTQINVHAETQVCHALKFVASLNENNDAPFLCQIKSFFYAALISTLLYGSESRLGGDLRPTKKLYMWCIK